MENLNNYWRLLESLSFPSIGAITMDDSSRERRVKINLKILQDFFKLTPADIVKNIIEDEGVKYLMDNIQQIVEKAEDYFLYCLYSLKMLLEIRGKSHFSSEAKEDLISERHKSLIISSMVDISEMALQENLHMSFYKEKLSPFKKASANDINFFRLEFLVHSFTPLIFIRELHVGKSLDDVQLFYMVSIFSLVIAYDTHEYSYDQIAEKNLENNLQKLWLEFSKNLYYRNLMLLFSSLPNTQRHRIHKEMLLKLLSPGGFKALLFAMAESKHSEEQTLDEVVANIVARPDFSIKAQCSLVKQILKFLQASQKHEHLSTLMCAALLSLRKLYDNNKENKEHIKNWLANKMKPLIATELTNIIAMEWISFVELIALLFQIFCTSSIATLPSDLLAPYLPVYLDLYSQLESHTKHDNLINNLQSLILKILNNRSKIELKSIIECVYKKSYPEYWFLLDSKIQVKENPLNLQELKLAVVDNESISSWPRNKYPLATLVSILKNSSYNLLVYQHFQILLQLVPFLIINSNTAATSNTSIDLLTTEEDIYGKIVNVSLMYEEKVQIVKALETLVQHKPLKTLIRNNIKDLLEVLVDILRAYTENNKDTCQTEETSSILAILIILLREILDHCSTVGDVQKNIIKSLKCLESKIQSDNLKYQLNCLLEIINKEATFGGQNCNISKNDFEEARTLIESNESYLQVQGIEMMIKLLNKRDTFTAANGHMLTALALNTLKSPESYTFLNCIRLFVALINVNECEILDLLSGEYLNEDAATDFRLLVGEVILKTCKELGPLCYKYKNILLNTFMSGCRSSLNEFRFSAYSNLSQMCRQLTYQVHNYFQELLNLIDCELTTGDYLPAKRAAVMVLSELLAGMDNLFHYEEMLLPIYRVLKYLVVSEKNDEKMRIHAENGLRCLSEKCKELLKTVLDEHQQSISLEKEIKIMDIHAKRGKNLKSHILEMS